MTDYLIFAKSPLITTGFIAIISVAYIISGIGFKRNISDLKHGQIPFPKMYFPQCNF